MARVTVQDCVKIVENRFELILLASERAKTLAKGTEPLLDRDRDKNPVVALREIAEKVLDLKSTESELIKGLQKYHEEILTDSEDALESSNADNITAKSDSKLEEQLIDDDLIKDLETNADEAGLTINEHETE